MDILTMTKGINHKPISENRSGIVFFESKSCETIMKYKIKNRTSMQKENING